MQLTKLGHACLHISDGDASVLIDPGSWSSGFEELRGLSAILVTHQHADHLDMDRIGGLVDANPQALLVADRDSAQQLGEAGRAPWLKAGEAIDFLRAVAPQVAVPIHERTLAMPEMEYARFERLAPADTEVRVFTDGDSTDLS